MLSPCSLAVNASDKSKTGSSLKGYYRNSVEFPAIFLYNTVAIAQEVDTLTLIIRENCGVNGHNMLTRSLDLCAHVVPSASLAVRKPEATL